jgi:hypothetical protein
MATTMFFEETLRDKEGAGQPVHLEFGRSSYYHGESLVYLTIDDKTVILDEATGRRLVEAMASLGSYLSYND